MSGSTGVRRFYLKLVDVNSGRLRGLGRRLRALPQRQKNELFVSNAERGCRIVMSSSGRCRSTRGLEVEAPRALKAACTSGQVQTRLDSAVPAISLLVALRSECMTGDGEHQSMAL